jgi:pyridoxine 5-phosphate synthase
MALHPVRLGVNIDHVATLRNARGGQHPDPFTIAVACVQTAATSATPMRKKSARKFRHPSTWRWPRPRK